MAEPAKPRAPYVAKGPHVRASAAQLWRLNKHDGYMREALQRSGGEYVQADVAFNLIAFLMQEGKPNEGGPSLDQLNRYLEEMNK